MEDIDAVLDDADELLVAVERIYQETLRAKQQSRTLKPKIKSVLEHQRSALDYLANGIHEVYGKKARAKIYYPIARKPKDFRGRIEQRMPGVLGARADIAECIELHQPYQPNREWLGWLDGLVNNNKHRNLSALKEDEGMHYEFADINLTVKQSNRGRIVVGPEEKQISVEQFVGGPAQVKREIWVDWLFAKPKLPVLQVLKGIQVGVRSATSEIAAVAGL